MNTSSKEDITKMAFAGANNKLGQFNYSNSNKNEYDAATPSYLRIRENESKFIYFVFNFFSCLYLILSLSYFSRLHWSRFQCLLINLFWLIFKNLGCLRNENTAKFWKIHHYSSRIFPLILKLSEYFAQSSSFSFLFA